MKIVPEIKRLFISM